ncbi:MAG: alpha/beta hydrolase [Fibrobacterales bacterium]
MLYKLIVCVWFLMMFNSCEWIRDGFTFFPDQESKIDEESLPSHMMKRQIGTSDGELLDAFFLNKTDSVNKNLVIYFHGNAGNVYDRLEYAEILYQMGYSVLLVSYRGYAESSGSPSESGIYLDGESALKYAMDSLKFDLRNITIFGRSLGTTVAVNTAQNKKLKGVILVSPLVSGKEMAKRMIPGISSLAGDSYNSIGKIHNLTSKLLIIHGSTDRAIPISMGKELFEAFSGEKYFVEIEGGGHNNLQDVDYNKYWGSVRTFVGSP